MDEKPALSGAGGHGGGGAPAQAARVELDTVSLDPSRHRINDFQCAKSQRCAEFFTRDMPRLMRAQYTRVFVFENPTDRDQIWGYYTLSPAGLQFSDLTRSQQKGVPGSIPVAVARIGFLARDDRAPSTLGAGLLVDAARRVLRSEVMTAWGFILEPEGGSANIKLWNWYKDKMGFTPIIGPDGNETGSMYCPLKRLIPEEWNKR